MDRKLSIDILTMYTLNVSSIKRYMNCIIPWAHSTLCIQLNTLFYLTADSVSVLDEIEEISGYLVIHSVGRAVLRFPRLRVIRGQEFIQVKNRRIALLVSSNYLLQTEHTTALRSERGNHFVFLQHLEMPYLICEFSFHVFAGTLVSRWLVRIHCTQMSRTLKIFV